MLKAYATVHHAPDHGMTISPCARQNSSGGVIAAGMSAKLWGRATAAGDRLVTDIGDSPLPGRGALEGVQHQDTT